MAISPNATQITPPRVPIIDERTGAVSREWYRWFYSLYNIVGGGLGIIPVSSGGTGLSTIPTNGQLLIGNGTGYTLNTLGVGAGISVTNGAGTISVANTGVLSNIAGTGISVSNATGDVTIANTGVLSFSGGTTGLTPAAITTGDVTLAGLLGIANGGTNGSSTPTAGAVPYGTGTAYAFTAVGTAGQVLTSNGAGVPTWATNASGDVVGPASSTDNAIARFDTTTGKLIQNSVVTIDDTGAATGFTTLSASTSLTTPIVQASNSAGLSLKNASGTTQMSVGAGGGDNMSINVSTNLNGTNAQIDISPTGTGHVHIKPGGTGSIEIAPTNAGTMNNMVIGGATPLAITGTTITATTFNGSGSGLTSIPNSALTNSTISGVSLGGSLFNLTAGTGVSFSTGTTYNGSAAITINATGTGGTVTSVAALTLGTTGTDLSSTVANSTTTPVITLNVPTASAANRGALSAADWTTFNDKQTALVSGTNIKTVNGTTLLGSGDLGTITTAYGGTGLSSYTAGDLSYYASGTAFTKLAIGAANTVLTSSGSAPQWSTGLLITSLTVTNGSSNTNVNLLSDAAAAFAVGRYSTNVNAPAINLRKGRGTIAAQTTVASGDLIGDIFGQVYDGTNTINATLIRTQVITYTGAANINTSMQFLTRPTGGAAVVERMRITTGVSIGTTTDPGVGNLLVSGTVNTGGYTVATLPAGVTGARAYVTNALAPAFGAAVVGGGAVTIPVFFDGVNWIVG